MMVYTTSEVSKKLKMDPHKIGWLRKYGILPSIKAGKGYIFTEEAIDTFLREYQGADLGSENACIIAATRHKKSALH